VDVARPQRGARGGESRMTRFAPVALALGALACTDGGTGGDGAGAPDAGHPDAGPSKPVPLPLPFARILDDRTGTSHGTKFQGVVESHGPARNIPPALQDAPPARALVVRKVDGTRVTLWYTLPIPYAFAARVDETVQVTYREVARGYASSYGVRVDHVDGSADNEPRGVFEDGAAGPALEPSERYGLDFQFDPVGLPNPVQDTCGLRVRHALVVTLPPKTLRVDPGYSEPFPLPGGTPATFTLFDAWQLEDSQCGQAPEYSFGYMLRP